MNKVSIINMLRKTLSTTLILMAIVSLSACSSLSKIRGALTDDGGVNYQNNQAIKKLEVPPDLTQPEFDKSFELPAGGVISAVSLNNGTAIQQAGTANASGSNVGAIRRGDLSIIKTVSGKTVLQVNDTYPRSLVLTEIMLTRMGFATISKSTAGDVITAKYNGSDVTVDGKRKGFFSKAKSLVGMSGNDNKALSQGKSYRFSIINQQGTPIVRVSQVDGKALSDAAHTKIITLLNTAFNS
ncbi:MAG: putative lipoprotein [Cocleimonas sp.]|jgi:uncharacterized lipoprotein